MAYAAGAKILKDAGEQATDCEKQLSAALVEVENNAAADLKAVLKELYFKVNRRAMPGLDFITRFCSPPKNSRLDLAEKLSSSSSPSPR